MLNRNMVTRREYGTGLSRRRLVMEGVTELGVLLKNTVDALELDITARIKTAPVRVLSALFRRN